VQILRGREFRLLFGAYTVSLLGDGMVRVALPFAVLEIGGGAGEVGLVLAAHTLPLVACLLVGGVVADRASRRAVMVVADLVRIGSQGAIAALLVAGVAEVWSLALLAGVGGAASGFFNPASTGILPQVVAPEDLQRANGLRGTAQAAGEVAGPIMAGVLVAAVGAGWAMAVDAATFVVSALLLARLSIAPVREVTASFVADLTEGWREFVARRWVWSFVAGASAGNVMWGAWSVLGPVTAERSLGGAAAWGTVVAGLGAGALLGGVWAIRMRPRRPVVVATAAASVLAVPLALLATEASVPLLTAGAAVSGAALMVSNTVFESALQRHVPAAALSRVSAYDWFGSLALRPVGLAVWGPIAVAIGLGPALWIAFGLLVATSLAVIAVPDVRRLRS
jgi:hypothetical protein